MSHKRDNLDASNFKSDGLQPFVDNWILDVAIAAAGSSPQGSGSDSLGNFWAALVHRSAAPAATGSSLSPASGAAVSVAEGGKATIGGRATAAVDFTGSSGTLVI